MQASIWDETPNRVLIDGTSTQNGVQSVSELIVNHWNEDDELPVVNSYFVNMNPYDTFFLNQRGSSMENQHFII